VLVKRFIISIIVLFCVFNASATHIVGGEFEYSYLGSPSPGLSKYRVVFYLYRDCLNGNPPALKNDEEGSFGIFNNSNNSFFDRFKLNFSSQAVITTGFSNSCINNAPPVCLNRMKFSFETIVPNNTNGYTILYERCCRNEAVNIENAGGDKVGSTFFININTQYGPNNSAVFKNYPPQIICINNPLIYDNGAIDPDGDSLSYELCSAKDIPANIGGTNPSNPGPNELVGPQFVTDVPYSFGFNANNPISSNPAMYIENKTGIIHANPNIQGRFVVTVCCNEWRSGKIINTVRRDFQFEITNCSKAVIANTPTFSQENNTYVVQCKGFDVKFFNTSIGGFSYLWDFGVQGITTDTSSLKEPTFTYPDTGTYKIKLIVNKGSTCPDSIERIVKVYPYFKTDFSFAGLICPNEPIIFTDLSSGNLYGPILWNWNFGDGTTSADQNNIHRYVNNGGIYNVSLVSGNGKGCLDTSIKKIDMKAININATDDTLVLKGEVVGLYVTGASSVQWTPSTYMDDATSLTPKLIFPDTGTYYYYVKALTTEGCTDSDKVKIIVVADIQLFMPNAFSPNGDYLNEIARIVQAGYGDLDYLRFYDRWGKMLYFTNYFREGWDGTYGGKPCDIGTYYWMASAKNIRGESRTFKGEINLIR
jgi:gliding motility-associated-like protein